MKKNRIFRFAFFLALVLLLNLFGVGASVKASSNSMTIKLPEYESLRAYLSSESAQDIKYWNLSNKYSIEDYLTKKDQIASDLHALSEGELSKEFTPLSTSFTYIDGDIQISGLADGLYYFRNEYLTEQESYKSEFVVALAEANGPIILIDKVIKQPLENAKIKLIKHDQANNLLQGVGFEFYDSKDKKVPLIGNFVYGIDGDPNQVLHTDANGEINITGLPYGNYYLKEVKALPGYTIINEKTEISLTDNEIEIIRVVNNKTETGGHRFLKIDSSDEKLPLEGAKFRVTQVVDKKEVPVIKDGKELQVESDSKGEFEVMGLPYGDYKLWEIKAPKGYVKLVKGIKFTIDDKSHDKVLIIKNSKEPPIKVPKTGDMVIPMLLISSITLFGSGYKLSKSKKQK